MLEMVDLAEAKLGGVFIWLFLHLCLRERLPTDIFEMKPTNR